MLQGLKITASTILISSALMLTSHTAHAEYVPNTATGLDQIITIINEDVRLNRRVPAQNIADASYAADMMNIIIVEAIKESALANDGNISKADAREINDYIFANYAEEWLIYHGDDEGGVETGFHLVQGNGAKTKLFGKNAINKVADGIYHLGFETHRRNRLMNEDGDKNAGFAKVASWLNGLLAEDLSGEILRNPEYLEIVGDTGTHLDSFIDIIYTDPGLQKRISTGDMREGAASANGMNHIIIDSIIATGIANDGEFTKADMQTLNQYIFANYEDEWIVLHGDDEDGVETGFHLVQSDGAKTRVLEKNAINKIADGLYHLGFEGNAKQLLNEDGNNNVRLKVLARWMNALLADELVAGVLSSS